MGVESLLTRLIPPLHFYTLTSLVWQCTLRLVGDVECVTPGIIPTCLEPPCGLTPSTLLLTVTLGVMSTHGERVS